MPEFGTSWDKVDKMFKTQFRDRWIGISALIIAVIGLVIAIVK